jgi:tight adherence protein B
VDLMMPAFLLCVLVACLGLIAMIRLARGKDLIPPRVAARRQVAAPAGTARNVMIALIVAVAVTALTRWPVAGLMAGAVVVVWPKLARAGAIEKASVAKVEAIASWTESLRDAAASESALESALPATVAGAPSLLVRPLRNLVNRLELRHPLPTVLARFADEVNDPGADMVVAALALNAQQRAGSLKRVLSALASNTRAELEMRRKVLNERNGVRRQANQVALGILGLAGVQAVFLRDWVAPYGTLAGQLILAVLAGVYLLLLIRLQRLAAPEPHPRFLSDVDALTEAAERRVGW